jgi:hypothetical protein
MVPPPTAPPLLNSAQILDAVTSSLRVKLNSLFYMLLQLPFPCYHVEGYMSCQELSLVELTMGMSPI